MHKNFSHHFEVEFEHITSKLPLHLHFTHYTNCTKTIKIIQISNFTLIKPSKHLRFSNSHQKSHFYTTFHPVSLHFYKRKISSNPDKHYVLERVSSYYNRHILEHRWGYVYISVHYSSITYIPGKITHLYSYT